MTEQRFADRNILDYNSYEDYLDQQVTEDDLLYLGDSDAARAIVELGYKGKDLLSREEFEAAQQLALEGPARPSEEPDHICSAAWTYEEGSLLAALAQREGAVRAGRLSTIIFLRDYVRGHEVSAYIDYGHRLRTEDFTSYFSKARRFLPSRGDLSYYDWQTHTLLTNNSTTFHVLAEDDGGVLMKHKRDRKTINVDPSAATPGDNTSRVALKCKDYVQVVLFDHFTRRKN